MLNEILGFQIIIQILDYVIKTPPPKSLLNYGVTLWKQTKAEVFCSILPLRPISFLLVELHEKNNI